MRSLYDIHGHFLPGMDDGCKTAEESIEVLRQAKEQGVQVMFATPHYYPVESIEAFLHRRTAAVERLKQAMGDAPEETFPKICLGAEVELRPGLSSDPMLERLCLGGTRYLLTELPWGGWGSDILRELRNLGVSCGITPVMAHLERYVSMAGWRAVAQVLEQDVLVQVNAGSFLRFADRQAVKKILRYGGIHLLGADCHNLTTRRPNMDLAAAYMEKHGLKAVLEQTCAFGAQIYEESNDQYRVR